MLAKYRDKLKAYLGPSKFKWVSFIGLVLIILVVVFYLMSYIASLQAASLFNKIMADQKLLEGNIKVETLSANLFGRVTFTNLEWSDETGGNVVTIPEGTFRVKPRDVVFRQLKPSSITEAALMGANITLSFDDNMHIKGLKIMQEPKKPKPKDEKKKPEPIDLKLKDMNIKLNLTDCDVTALYKNRRFELDEVNADIHYNSKDKIAIDFSIGDFGGTLVGDGLILRGDVDLKPEMATCDLNLTVKELNPSSLGTGLNIHEKVTAIAKVTGQVADPTIEGKLAMKALNLPGLRFTDLTGDYIYDDGVITASDVKAKIFNGTCDANGYFNIDTKAYDVNCLGHNLQGGVAAHTPLLSCDIELNLKMRCNGDNKSTETFGHFNSGHGRYAIIAFNNISGSFHNQFNNLVFTDVVIHTPLGEVMSPEFALKDGKLRMGEVYVGNRNTGEKVRLHF